MRGLAFFALFASACGCGPEPQDHSHHDQGPFAVEVVSFTPGPGAGKGQDQLPDVVLGAPHGGGENKGNVDDVLSLGKGGEIILRLGREAADGAGPDFIVFENAFKIAGGDTVFAEPGEVSVSDDGVAFAVFPCAPANPAPNGCAGEAPVLAGDGDDATNPDTAGGDQFDLADLGLASARFIRIVDKGPGGPAPSAGFDLDAVAVASHP